MSITPIQDYLWKSDGQFDKWLIDKEQGRIEVKILPYLQHIKKGFFVEAGASDGLFMSNTKILEDLGWEGLLIEPSHKAAENCKKNRTAQIEECALVSKDYDKEYVMGDFVLDGEGGIGAWSSINRQAYGRLSGRTFNSFYTAVKAKTLAQVFKERDITKVDYLSLDVEGYELEALKGVDFEKVEITFILAEVNFKDYTLEDMDNFLGSKGYKRLDCLSNFSKETNEGWDGSHQDYLYKHE